MVITLHIPSSFSSSSWSPKSNTNVKILSFPARSQIKCKSRNDGIRTPLYRLIRFELDGPMITCSTYPTHKTQDQKSCRGQVAVKSNRGHVEESEEVDEGEVAEDEKKGTVAGAVALIIGTSIGSGILALPQKASPAGILPSSISMIICWGFLLVEALLLVEVNVALRRKRQTLEDGQLEIVSIRTMAQETLGNWGGTLATIVYVFLGYTSMVAYSSKSGEIMFHLFNIPEPVSACIFTSVFTMLLLIGGTNATDRVNQWLTVSMIGLLVAIEVLAVVFGGWSGLDGSGNWGKIPATIPVLIFSLVYHDLAPVLCAYLGGDLRRLRASVVLGSFVPLAALLVWDAIALGLSAEAGQVADPVDLLMSVKWSGVAYLVDAFSLLAIGTSLIGTLLGFSEFFKEQLKSLAWHSRTSQLLQDNSNTLNSVLCWWDGNKIGVVAMAMVVTPTLFISTAVPDAFSAATDIAGGYCMTMLYGVLPPAMAWAMHDKEHEETNQNVLSTARPALLGVGVFACGIVLEQIMHDFSAALHP